MAARIVTIQAGVSLLVASAFLARDWRSATGAFAGGALVMAGNALLAARMFAGRHLSAGAALFGFLVGTALKWLVLLGGLYALFAAWRLPPGPVIAGLVVALLVNLMALRFKE